MKLIFEITKSQIIKALALMDAYDEQAEEAIGKYANENIEIDLVKACEEDEGYKEISIAISVIAAQQIAKRELS